MKNALTAPITAPSATATATATGMGTPFLTLRIATIIAESVSVLATDKSKSPAVSGRIRARVRTTMMELKPSIDA